MQNLLLILAAILFAKELYIFGDDTVIHLTFISLLILIIRNVDLISVFDSQRESIRETLKKTTSGIKKTQQRTIIFVSLNKDLRVLAD